MASFPQWEYDLLGALGAPTSANNLTALNLWAQSEGNVINNPLATSGRGAGASVCVAQCGSTSPIYEYSTEAQGVAQMSRFLGGSYYTNIVNAFRQDAGLAAIYSAINASPWCSGCQNGRYPEALAAALGGKVPATSPTVGGGSVGAAGSSSGGSGSSGSGNDLSQCFVGITIPTAGNIAVQFFTLGLLNTGGEQKICFLTRGNVKWFSGVAALVFGAGLFGFGVVMLAAWGADVTGAKQAVTGAARKVGIAGSLLSGQPEVAAGIAATTKRSSSSSKSPRTVGLGPSARPSRPPARAPDTAGILESRRIERRFQAAQRDTGPIGPRGASASSRRAYERRTSSPGAGRRPTPEQRRRATESYEARRARRRAEGFERVS